jgi:hypothetical protein
VCGRPWGRGCVCVCVDVVVRFASFAWHRYVIFIVDVYITAWRVRQWFGIFTHIFLLLFCSLLQLRLHECPCAAYVISFFALFCRTLQEYFSFKVFIPILRCCLVLLLILYCKVWQKMFGQAIVTQKLLLKLQTEWYGVCWMKLLNRCSGFTTKMWQKEVATRCRKSMSFCCVRNKGIVSLLFCHVTNHHSFNCSLINY